MLRFIFMSLLSNFVSYIYNFRFFIYKKPKVVNIRNEITFTPNLTLYYPLKMSILSVSIRFMGTILLFVYSFCISFFLILNFLNIPLEFISLIFLLNLFVFFLTFFYHTVNSLSHFIDNFKTFFLDFENLLKKLFKHRFLIFLNKFLKVEILFKNIQSFILSRTKKLFLIKFKKK